VNELNIKGKTMITKEQMIKEFEKTLTKNNNQ